MRESTIENRFREEVLRRGGFAYKFTVPGMRGVPDRIVLLPGGRTVFAELKAPGKPLSPMQVKRAEELKAKGYAVYKIDSYADVRQFIAEVFG